MAYLVDSFSGDFFHGLGFHSSGDEIKRLKQQTCFLFFEFRISLGLDFFNNFFLNVHFFSHTHCLFSKGSILFPEFSLIFVSIFLIHILFYVFF